MASFVKKGICQTIFMVFLLLFEKKVVPLRNKKKETNGLYHHLDCKHRGSGRHGLLHHEADHRARRTEE
jgi:hypothetical protein